MFKNFLVFTAMAFSMSAQARFIESKVVDVDVAGANDEVMVMLESGEVLWLEAAEQETIKALKAVSQRKSNVALDYDPTTHKLLGAHVTDADDPTPAEYMEPQAFYTPTVLRSQDNAQAAFNTMDKRTKSDSQCYNRAHGWAYDLWRTHRINSQKLFLFFTRKYIRAYRYHWWFHVTPTTYVQTEGGVQERILDRSFTRGPLAVRTWTNIFMRNDAECRVVTRYSSYRNNQQAEWCYLIRASMYYRTPNDLDLLERRGRQETVWVTSEVRQARKQAFIYWRNYNP